MNGLLISGDLNHYIWLLLYHAVRLFGCVVHKILCCTNTMLMLTLL
jgi:hypothetical protein